MWLRFVEIVGEIGVGKGEEKFKCKRKGGRVGAELIERVARSATAAVALKVAFFGEHSQIVFYRADV